MCNISNISDAVIIYIENNSKSIVLYDSDFLQYIVPICYLIIIAMTKLIK